MCRGYVRCVGGYVRCDVCRGYVRCMCVHVKQLSQIYIAHTIWSNEFSTANSNLSEVIWEVIWDSAFSIVRIFP